MNKADATEAAPIVVRCCQYLLRTINPQGKPGIGARTQMGDTIAHAYEFLRANELGPELDACFTQAMLAGASLPEIEFVRRLVAQESPVTVGGLLVQNSLIQFCLATSATIIANMILLADRTLTRSSQYSRRSWLLRKLLQMIWYRQYISA
jgi:hypothetical protein